MIKLMPNISTKAKGTGTLAWKNDGTESKTMNFALTYYCENGNY
jgi:hypothetical protein